MNQPWVYMYSPSRSPHPPPSLPNPSGSPQCTRSEHFLFQVYWGVIDIWSCKIFTVYIVMIWCLYTLRRASQVALVVNHRPASAEDSGDESLILESGRSPGAGNGNPLQSSWSFWNPWKFSFDILFCFLVNTNYKGKIKSANITAQ